MPDLHLLARTLRRTLPRAALAIQVLVLAALTAAPVTLPAVTGCAAGILLTILLVVAESRLVETCAEAEDLCRLVGELRTELTAAYTDPITGLPLRRIAESRLADPGAAVTVALIDVDDMHGVNDVHGHHGGDAYLAGVAALLADAACADDTVARLGGDEFVVISTRAPDAVATALTAVLSAAVTVVGGTVAVRFSAGVHRIDPRIPHTALGCADLAMYTAKRSGGGVAVYDATRDGTPSVDPVRPQVRARNRSSVLRTGPVTAAAPTCWQCGAPDPAPPAGVRRCGRCGAGLVFDDAVGSWISPAEEVARRRADDHARQVAVSEQRVAEVLPALAGRAPAGWSVTAAVSAAGGASHAVAVDPPARSVDATAYLAPNTDRADSAGWTVRVHHRGQGVDFPLYTDGGARAARFSTAADALDAAVLALRIEIAAARG